MPPYCPRSPGSAVLEPGGGRVDSAVVAILGSGLLLCGLPWYVLEVNSPRLHILYPGGLACDPQHPAGVGWVLPGRLQSGLFTGLAVIWTALVVLLVGLGVVFVIWRSVSVSIVPR